MILKNRFLVERLLLKPLNLSEIKLFEGDNYKIIRIEEKIVHPAYYPTVYCGAVVEYLFEER